MDETTRALIDLITVRCDPPRMLPDGRTSPVFFDCSRLSPNDLSRLAAQAAGDLDEHTFDAVVGLAYDGILFASAVAGGKQVHILQTDGVLWGASISGKRVLIADDVVFTQSRALEAVTKLRALGAIVVGVVCVVDRSQGEPLLDNIPLYSAYQVRSE